MDSQQICLFAGFPQLKPAYSPPAQTHLTEFVPVYALGSPVVEIPLLPCGAQSPKPYNPSIKLIRNACITPIFSLGVLYIAREINAC
ncbi:hypothetical protein EVAR_98329_1 [Eumeta japonica]|uniref:Uncharacterized protein n=1 Tax=Eumeta variegata TaxID=151549 RepID=A0A4C1XBS7_EUMVA|nr:hypothetical protein EVAR_98329_1 [Eumeta japonica]